DGARLANAEAAWVQANKPNWQILEQGGEGHFKYGWTDASGNVHIVVGWLGHGSRKQPEQNAIRNVRREMERCERGACKHVFSDGPGQAVVDPSQSGDVLPDFRALQNGQVIEWNGDRFKVEDRLPEEGITVVRSFTTGEEVYVGP